MKRAFTVHHLARCSQKVLGEELHGDPTNSSPGQKIVKQLNMHSKISNDFCNCFFPSFTPQPPSLLGIVSRKK